MKFTINYDKNRFTAEKIDIDSIINRLNLFYKYSDKNKATMSILITDSKEIEEYAIRKIKSFENNFQIFNLENHKSRSLQELQTLIDEQKHICIKGMNEYISYLESIMSENEKKEVTAESLLYLYAFTMTRDNVFLKKHSKIILIMDSKEFRDFNKNSGHNFISYCSVHNLNTPFISDNKLNLDEYINDYLRTKDKINFVALVVASQYSYFTDKVFFILHRLKFR